MNSLGRRDFIKTMSLFAVAPGLATTARYDAAGKFDLKVSEVEYRRTKAGRSLLARIYQPAGAGPFPTVLDLHGDACTGSAVSGLCAGCQLRRTLAQNESGIVERRSFENRSLWQLQRRPRRRTARDAASR